MLSKANDCGGCPIANARVNIPFKEALFRGVLCNRLVCLAVWIAPSSTDTVDKIFFCSFLAQLPEEIFAPSAQPY